MYNSTHGLWVAMTGYILTFAAGVGGGVALTVLVLWLQINYVEEATTAKYKDIDWLDR